MCYRTRYWHRTRLKECSPKLFYVLRYESHALWTSSWTRYRKYCGMLNKSLSPDAIFLSTCNTILLLRLDRSKISKYSGASANRHSIHNGTSNRNLDLYNRNLYAEDNSKKGQRTPFWFTIAVLGGNLPPCKGHNVTK